MAKHPLLGALIGILLALVSCKGEEVREETLTLGPFVKGRSLFADARPLLGKRFDATTNLEAGVPLDLQRLPLKGGRGAFLLKGLAASKHYECKLSYPASIPAIIKMELAMLDLDKPRESRRLLNTEKIFLATDKHEQLQDVRGPKESSPAVVVTVQPEGVPTAGGKLPEFLYFNIEVEELDLFGLPLSTHRAALLAVLLLLLVAWLLPYIPALLLLERRDNATGKGS